MEIGFPSAKLQKLFNSAKKLQGKYGQRMGRLIQQRMMELDAAENLEVMRSIVGARCHELKGRLKECLAVDLVHPDRLVFRPDHNPVPEKESGGLDWQQVTKIEIVGVGDYH